MMRTDVGGIKKRVRLQSLASEPLCVKQSIPGCPSLIPEPVQEDSRGQARRAMQLEEDRRNNGCGTKQV